jgi:hypothetical protein
MIAIISLFTILVLSILITRVASVALIHTGLSRETARFQARSAFTGVGFTTKESEKVVNHPVRRKILHLLMLIGNAGIITAMSSLILSFINIENSSSFVPRIILLVTGLVVLFGIASSKWVDRHLSNLISRALKRYTLLEIHDYYSLLRLSRDYRVTELGIDANDWVTNKPLKEIRLREEGVMVLGITREDGSYIGAPNGETKILPGDSLILYGRVAVIEDLDIRRRGKRGDRQHDKKVAEQQKILQEEKKSDIIEE